MYGFITAIVIMTENDLKTPLMNIKNYAGNNRSKTMMSFENLVSILPIGLESKKTIFALSTRFVTEVCMSVILLRINL